MAIQAVDPNQRPVDVYTLYHVAFGVALCELGATALQALAISLIWEHVIEPYYKARNPEIFPAPSQDSPVNSALDTVAVMAGWYASRRYGTKS